MIYLHCILHCIFTACCIPYFQSKSVWHPYRFSTECNRSFLREVSARTTCLTLKNEGKFRFLYQSRPHIKLQPIQKLRLGPPDHNYLKILIPRGKETSNLQYKILVIQRVLGACNTHVTTWAMGEANFLENGYYI